VAIFNSKNVEFGVRDLDLVLGWDISHGEKQTLKEIKIFLPWYQGGCWSQDLVLVLGLWVSCSWGYKGFASIS